MWYWDNYDNYDNYCNYVILGWFPLITKHHSRVRENSEVVVKFTQIDIVSIVYADDDDDNDGWENQHLRYMFRTSAILRFHNQNKLISLC
jgi:hypothetical protein